MRNGAYDFIEKPFPAERLVDAVRRALEKRALTLENRNLRRELETHNGPGPWLIGKSPAIQRLRRLVLQVAGMATDVLIVGETGTGKELVAHHLHEYSNRQQQRFVAVNCGALPEHLIESELFGHEPGAFTGAQQRRIGKFEHANGGTLFLDEIESMPLALQVRLLRALQERTIERLGSNTDISLDLRVIAATKVDLKEASAQGTFREDLYYRLNVVILNIPPLRDRREDVPLLFQHFALMAAARHERPIPALSSAGVRALMAHTWPGNVRELRNAAERYVLLGESDDYDPALLLHGSGTNDGMTLPEQVECFEKCVIEYELMRHRGSIAATLETLGLPRKTLYDKMRKYGLDRRHYT
jgi:two-component system C4-dicarboxylate transport response regulator DctD